MLVLGDEPHLYKEGMGSEIRAGSEYSVSTVDGVEVEPDMLENGPE